MLASVTDILDFLQSNAGVPMKSIASFLK